MANFETDLIFVYGTLKRNLRHPEHERLFFNTAYIGEAFAFGELFRIDWYPGFIPGIDESRKVFGEVYRMKQPTLMLKHLDQYEGVRSLPGSDDEYERSVISVFLTKDQLKKEAFVYCYKWSIESANLIPTGVF